VLTGKEAQASLCRESNAEVVMPYLTVSDLCDRSTVSPSRMVVNFKDMSETAAKVFREPFDYILANVKPDRQRVDANGNYILRSPLPQRWWQYNEQRKQLYLELRGLEFAIAIPRTSKHMIPLAVETGCVFSDGMFVVASDDFGLLAVLTSNIHRSWVIEWGGTMNTRFRYVPSRCFITFPFPTITQALREAGSRLSEHRTFVMRELDVGITELYNKVHDSTNADTNITTLRSRHVAVDRQTLVAFGWADIEPRYDFLSTPQGIKFTLDTRSRDVILDRLMLANHSALTGSTADGKPEQITFLAHV
jgi:hypothetical protein